MEINARKTNLQRIKNKSVVQFAITDIDEDEFKQILNAMRLTRL